MNGKKLTDEAMRKAREAQQSNNARTLGSNDQRRNHADVKRYKNITP